MATIFNPTAEGDLNNTGTAEPLYDGLTASAGVPVNVSFFSFDLKDLTAAQVSGIEAGTTQISLTYQTAGSAGSHDITFSGAGITTAAETALTSGSPDPSAYRLITNPSDTLTTTTVNGTLHTQTLNITNQVAAALESGDQYYLVGAYETKGGQALATASLAVTCFAAGTRIAAARGALAVEDLRPGDRVATGADGVWQPIAWIGERRINLRAHPRPAQAAPVRIHAGAFADGVPARDLLLSPEHCVFADGVLIPVRQLLNGVTVTQDLLETEVHYFHVELERHSLLRAEGLLAESYLDTGNRAMFANGGLALVLHPEFALNAGCRAWDRDACAPLATIDQARTVWLRLVDRAAALGLDVGLPAPAPLADASPRLLAGGQSVAPVMDGDRLVFVLPPGADRTLHLVSSAATPADERPWEDDRRLLGLCVRGLMLRGPDGLRRVALDDPSLGAGWWEAETSDGHAWRWTDGDAALTLPPGDTAETLEVVLKATTVARQPDRRAA